MLGNYVADALAGVAAEDPHSKVIPNDCLAYFWSLSMVRKVQTRLLKVASISIAAHEEKKRQNKDLQPAQDKQQGEEQWLAAAAKDKQTTLAGHRLVSAHSLVVIDNKFFCTECKGWQPMQEAAAKEWL
jgi:hypothetical protein